MKRILSILMFIAVAVFFNSVAMAQSNDGPEWQKDARISTGEVTVYKHSPTESRIDVYAHELKVPGQAKILIETFHSKLKDSSVGFRLTSDGLACDPVMVSSSDCTRTQYQYETADVKDIKLEVVSFTKDKKVYFVVLYYPEKSRDQVWDEFKKVLTGIDQE